MKKTIQHKQLLGSLLIITLTTSGFAQTSWKILEDYTIEFSGTGAEGTFHGLEGTIEFDSQDLANSRFDVSVDPASIATGNKTKDKHARGKSWFNVERYIKIKFVSNTITSLEEGYVADGILTLHGVPRETQIAFTFTENAQGKAIFKGTLMVNRQDFEIEGPFISFMVGDEFVVNLVVPVKK